MAKRKRLTPPQPGYLAPAPGYEIEAAGSEPVYGLEAKSWLRPGVAPPIAQVAGDASASAALQQVAATLTAARREGRLVERLALDAVDVGYLVRDRIETDEEELGHLMDSLRAHGQRQPIEVTEIAPGRYGLISGWRRMTALARLQAQTGDAGFGSVLALLRRPESSAAAYVSMVEENEVRLGLSYYERARIAAKAVELGVFETEKRALQQLFAAASRARRSKIGSFLAIYHRLDAVLRFPAALPERLGLALSKLIASDPAAADRLAAILTARPAISAAEELDQLAAAVEEQSLTAGKGSSAPPATPRQPAPAPPATDPVVAAQVAETQTATPAATQTEEIRPGVFLTIGGGFMQPQILLSGPAVGPEFRDRLTDWLRQG